MSGRCDLKERFFLRKAGMARPWGGCSAFVLLFCGLVLGNGARAQAQTRIITIDVPGASGTYATSVNASGTITGYYEDFSYWILYGGCHGFIRKANGTFITFDSPMSPASQPPSVGTCPQPVSISARGEIAGWYNDRTFGCPAWPDTSGGCGGQHGFLRMRNGAFITLDAPTDLQAKYGENTNPGTFPTSIAPSGDVTGIYASCGQSQCSDSFLRQRDGTFVSFDPPNANPFHSIVGANSINALGAIVGNYVDNSTGILHGFLRTPDGTFTTTDPPGTAGGSNAVSINSSGEILGNFSDVNNVLHGYLRAPDGTFTLFDFDVPGACYAAALRLNDKGTTLGWYFTLTASGCYGGAHFFLRTADGGFATFDVPGASSFGNFRSGPGTALAISSSNAVVGTYFDANGVAHGFLLRGMDRPPQAAREAEQDTSH